MAKHCSKKRQLSSKEDDLPGEEVLFLTEAEIRAYPKYKNATDEVVQNAIYTLHKLALVCFDAFCREEKAAEMAKNAEGGKNSCIKH